MLVGLQMSRPQFLARGNIACSVTSVTSIVSNSATPWTAARQVPLSMGFSWQEYWSGLPCSPPGHLPEPGIEHSSPLSPVLACRFFTTSTTWEAWNV